MWLWAKVWANAMWLRWCRCWEPKYPIITVEWEPETPEAPLEHRVEMRGCGHRSRSFAYSMIRDDTECLECYRTHQGRQRRRWR